MRKTTEKEQWNTLCGKKGELHLIAQMRCLIHEKMWLQCFKNAELLHSAKNALVED